MQISRDTDGMATMTATVDTYDEVMDLVNEHGDLMDDWQPAPWGIDTPETFLYRVRCEDGEVIDFYAANSQRQQDIYNETF